jgi:hypothetical protein
VKNAEWLLNKEAKEIEDINLHTPIKMHSNESCNFKTLAAQAVQNQRKEKSKEMEIKWKEKGEEMEIK